MLVMRKQHINGSSIHNTIQYKSYGILPASQPDVIVLLQEVAPSTSYKLSVHQERLPYDLCKVNEGKTAQQKI